MIGEIKLRALASAAAVVLSVILATWILAAGESNEPSYSQGSGSDDWWINYPNQSTEVGAAVEHPAWVLEALQEKPVLILDHSSDCVSCKVQIANLEKALNLLGDEVVYFDMLADGGDQKAFEVFESYSPTGEAYYVPTTVFVTLIKGPDGQVSVAWHSEEDAMGEEEIMAYMRDSIYYYQENAAEWSK